MPILWRFFSYYVNLPLIFLHFILAELHWELQIYLRNNYIWYAFKDMASFSDQSQNESETRLLVLVLIQQMRSYSPIINI